MVYFLQQANRFCSDHPAACFIEFKIMACLFMAFKSGGIIIKFIKEYRRWILRVLRDVELMTTGLIRQ